MAPGEGLEGPEPPGDGKSIFLLGNHARLWILCWCCHLGVTWDESLKSCWEQLGVEGVWTGRRRWNGNYWVGNELLLATNPGGSGVCSSQRGKMQTWSCEWLEQLLIPGFRNCSISLNISFSSQLVPSGAAAAQTLPSPSPLGAVFFPW